MMNWQALFLGMTDNEFSAVYDAVIKEKHRRNSEDSKNYPDLNEMEKSSAIENLVVCMKSYRERTGANLMIAKIKIDAYRESLQNVVKINTPEFPITNG
jgi:hypothetical protein